MEVRINETKLEPVIESQRIANVILTREEYDQLKTVFCKGKGWSMDHPHTVSISSISLTGKYKWMPESNVEFAIQLKEDEKAGTTHKL